MGFGNPYGDAYSPDLVAEFVRNLDQMGIKIISFADTVGTAEPTLISELYEISSHSYPKIEFGLHLHTHPEQLSSKITAALKAGCLRFDSAVLGFGGCPMANDDLVGNVATEDLVRILEQEGYELDLNRMEFAEARKLANVIFH